MNRVRRLLAVVVAVPLFLGLMLIVLSEKDEVVVLRTVGADGVKESRLWIVDGEQGPIVRGSPGKAWVENARSNPAVALHRGADWVAHEAVELTGDRALAETNSLMRAKYGFADEVIDMFDDFETAVAFVLVSRPPSGLDPAAPAGEGRP